MATVTMTAGIRRRQCLYAPNVMNAIDLKWYTYVIDRMIENIDGSSGDVGDGYDSGGGLNAPSVATSIAPACQQRHRRERRQLLRRVNNDDGVDDVNWLLGRVQGGDCVGDVDCLIVACCWRRIYKLRAGSTAWISWKRMKAIVKHRRVWGAQSIEDLAIYQKFFFFTCAGIDTPGDDVITQEKS